jgi:hypothetical protein
MRENDVRSVVCRQLDLYQRCSGVRMYKEVAGGPAAVRYGRAAVEFAQVVRNLLLSIWHGVCLTLRATHAVRTGSGRSLQLFIF